MPGQTNNPDLLSAVNQVIVVLNEIYGRLPSLANNPSAFISPPPATPPTGQTPPPGFDTWQAYLNYKCNVANWSFDSIQEFFRQTGNTLEDVLDISGDLEIKAVTTVILVQIFRQWGEQARLALGAGAPLTGTLIIGAAFVLLPEWVLYVIAGIIVGLIYVADIQIIRTYFGNIATELESAKEDTVCALYNAQHVFEAQIIITDLLEPIVAQLVTLATPTNPILAWTLPRSITQITTYLTMNDNLNKLFERDDNFLNYTGTNPVDCAGCGLDCGDPGTPQHFPIFSNSNEGTWSFTNNLFRLDGTVNAGQGVGYRYSGYFGGTWPTPPFPSREALSVNCSSNLDGTAWPQGANGYFQLFGPDLSIPAGAPAFRQGTTGWGHQDLAAVNAWLAGGGVCISIIVVSDASVASWLEVTFDAV